MTDTINWPALIRQQTLRMILDGEEPNDQLVLHWLPDEDRWEVFNWGHWLRLRATMFCDQVGLHAGLHYFVVWVHDHEGTHNLIPHKYLINPDSTIGADNFAGATKEQRAEHFQLSLKRELSEEEWQRINRIREKFYRAEFPPRESGDALLGMLDQKPVVPDSAAERFIRRLLT